MPLVPARVEQRVLPPCAMTTAREEQVFDRVLLGEDWERPPGLRTPGAELRAGGVGMAVADFDGDDHLDILVPRTFGRGRLLLGDGHGRFEDLTFEDVVFGEPPPQSSFVGASAADVDGDGDLDAVLYARYSWPYVLHNRGDGTFDARPLATDAQPVGCGQSASWGDVDNDGDLDLFLGRTQHRELDAPDAVECHSHLFVNRGDGSFVRADDRIPMDVHLDNVMASAFVQVDDDLAPELYVVSDLPNSSPGNRLLDMSKGRYRVTDSSLDISVPGMGLGIGDLNHDGRWDFVVPAVRSISVLTSTSSPGTWVDSSAALGVGPGPGQIIAWSGELVDLDLDTHLEITATYGPFGSRTGDVDHPEQPDSIFRRGGVDEPYEDVALAWNWASEWAGRGIVAADLNEDGWPDLIRREHGAFVHLDLSRCGDASWLQVALHDPGPNRFGIGATVRVEHGEHTQMRAIHAGSSSLGSSGPPVALFGLARATEVDRVVVTWPDGAVSESGPFPANRVLDVVRDAP